MVVKFLSSGSSFSGVRYNTNKAENGRGELMKVANFGHLQAGGAGPEDYRNYLRAYSALNEKVKDKQLHFVISCKGREVDKVMLAEYAEALLKELGYGKNPYLIIAHNDTDNNHVHVVSTRIDENGKKINDSFEQLRAIAALNRIVGIENIDAIKAVQEVLEYRFSTLAQGKMLLERKGFLVSEEKDVLILGQYGRKVAEVDIKRLKDHVGTYEKDKKEVQQLRAIFHKYKESYSGEARPVMVRTTWGEGRNKGYTSDLAEALKTKLGIEIIYHGKEGKPPYGYTIIDHKNKAVLKGGEVFAIAELMTKSTDPKVTHKQITVPDFKTRAVAQGTFEGAILVRSIDKNDYDRMALKYLSAQYDFKEIGEGLHAVGLEVKENNGQRLVYEPESGIAINSTDLVTQERHVAEGVSVHAEGFSLLDIDLAIADGVDDEAAHGKERKRSKR